MSQKPVQWAFKMAVKQRNLGLSIHTDSYPMSHSQPGIPQAMRDSVVRPPLYLLFMLHRLLKHFRI